jgi:hypothetical protein
MIRAGRGTSDQVLAHFYLNKSGGTIPSTTDHVMTFLQGGNVGIGTTSPKNKLSVIGSDSTLYYNTTAPIAVFQAVSPSTVLVAVDGNVDGYYAELKLGNAQSTYYPYSAYIRGVQGGGIDYYRLEFGTAAGSAAATRMTIANDGNVGIGTTSATSKLTILQSSGADSVLLELQSNNDPGIRFGRSTYGSLIRHVSATTDYIAFNCNGSSKPSVSATAQVVFNENGNVGIGTDSPTSKLHVVGNVQLYGTSGGNININTAASGNGDISFDGSTFTIVSNSSSASLVLSTNSTERFRITSAGNVGIGTTSPAAKLDVVGSAAISSTLTVTGATALNGAVNLSTSGTSTVTLGSASSYGVLTASGTNAASIYLNGANRTGFEAKLQFGAAEHQWFNGSLSSQIMTLNTNGLGIGTTSPVAKLSVYTTSPHGSPTGISVAAGTGGANLLARDSGSYHNWFPYTDGLNYYSADGHVFRSSNHLTNYVNINSNGNVGIGTSSPKQKLDIAGAGAGSIALTNTGTSGYSEVIFYEGSSVKGDIWVNGSAQSNYAGVNSLNILQNSNAPIAFYTNGNNERMRIDGGGNIGIGTTNPGANLSVIGEIYASSRVISDRYSSVTNGNNNSILFSSNTTSFINNGSTSVYINSSGNVGIGSTSPAHTLDVVGPNVSITNQPGIISRFTRAVDGRALLRVVNSDTNSTAAATHAGVSFVAYSNVSNRPLTNTHEAQIMLAGTGTGTNDLKFIAPQGMTFWVSGSNVNMTGSAYTNYGSQAIAITPGRFVGIGTSNPNYPLHVFNTTATLATFTRDLATDVSFTIGADNNGVVLGTLGVHAIQFYTNSTEKMRIISDGNIGIGTSTPSTKLAVEGGSVSAVNSTGTDVRYSFDIRTLVGGAIGFNNAAATNVYGAVTGSAYYGVAQSYPIVFTTGGTERLRIAAGGNVGIGTQTPAAKLEVNGTLVASSTIKATDTLYIQKNVGGYLSYITAEQTSASTGNSFKFWNSGGSTLMTMVYDGNIGIGTTAPAYKLEVNGSFAASTKSFKIDHPIKPGKKLVYGSLESPYHGIRLTGKDTLVGAKCVVKLPDYICKLVRAESVTIQLTGIKCGKTLYIDDINVSENYFVVAYEKSMLEFNKTYEFFWDFTAIRSDVPELMTEV